MHAAFWGINTISDQAPVRINKVGDSQKNSFKKKGTKPYTLDSASVAVGDTMNDE